MTYIVVVHNHILGLLKNVAAILHANNSAQVIVVDNSDDAIAKDIRDTLAQQHTGVIYIRSDVNNRFHAYNLAMNAATEEWVTFRTDDDSFDEHTYLELLEKGFGNEVMSGCHTFDNGPVECDGPERPIESFVFKRELLNDLFPIATESSSDWRLLRTLYESKTVSIGSMKRIVMHKLPHGRTL